MCGRMTLAWQNLDDVANEIGAVYAAAPAAGAGGPSEMHAQYRPRYNVAPTDRHPIVRTVEGQRQLGFASWGFTRPGRPIIINARSETAAARGAFREALAHRRCVIPADGFYEWSGPKEARQPHWIHRRDGHLLLFAGIWEDDAAARPPGRRFCVFTTSPNTTIAGLHDRMPVILGLDDLPAWLEEGRPELLAPAADDLLELRAVSPRVNSVKNDDPECLAPAPPPVRQLPLF